MQNCHGLNVSKAKPIKNNELGCVAMLFLGFRCCGVQFRSNDFGVIAESRHFYRIESIKPWS